jgi:hypothetical protein
MADDAARSRDVERRKNQRLRELVDEMLMSIREAAGRDLWTEEERAQYEAELEGIMARVRRQATAGGGAQAAGQGSGGPPSGEQASSGQEAGGGEAPTSPRRPG